MKTTSKKSAAAAKSSPVTLVGFDHSPKADDVVPVIDAAAVKAQLEAEKKAAWQARHDEYLARKAAMPVKGHVAKAAADAVARIHTALDAIGAVDSIDGDAERQNAVFGVLNALRAALTNLDLAAERCAGFPADFVAVKPVKAARVSSTKRDILVGDTCTILEKRRPQYAEFCAADGVVNVLREVKGKKLLCSLVDILGQPMTLVFPRGHLRIA